MAKVIVRPDQPKGGGCELEWLLAQTRRMYDFAVDGEWEKVAVLEGERKNSIDRCFSAQIGFDDPQIAVCYIQKIIELDKKVIAMGAEAQEVLGSALSDLKRGRQATQAYQKIGS